MKRKRKLTGHRRAGRKHNLTRMAMAKQRLQKQERPVAKKVFGEPSAAANLALTVAARTLEAEG